jgi:hypothetical protein
MLGAHAKVRFVVTTTSDRQWRGFEGAVRKEVRAMLGSDHGSIKHFRSGPAASTSSGGEGEDSSRSRSLD